MESIDTINLQTIIGVISVARLLEMKKLFKNMALFFVKKFNNLKLRKKEGDEMSKLIDSYTPDDLIVKEAFKKEGYYDKTHSTYLMNLLNTQSIWM